jgi:hypothetical protein
MYRMHSLPLYSDDSQKNLGAVLSYMTGRTLSKTRSGGRWNSAVDGLRPAGKGNSITADNLRKAAPNLGINQVELLIRSRLIHPEEIRSLAEEIGSPQPFALPRRGR